MQLHLEDLRPVQFISIFPPAVNGYIKFVKLHRAKGCPSPFAPLETAPRRSSPHAAPCQTDVDAAYCKFNYVEPAAYQSHLNHNLRELEQLPVFDSLDALCRAMAFDRVKRELESAIAELSEELALMERFQNPAAGFYVEQPRQLLASTNKAVVVEVGAIESSLDHAKTTAVHEDHQSHVDRLETTRRFQGVCFESEPPLRSGSEAFSSSVTDPSSPKQRSQSELKAIPATMFLDDDDSAFYQIEDGSLCFLSGFNMNCLRTEFSPGVPDERCLSRPPLQGHDHNVMPLPDTIEGKVVEIERMHLTPDTRSRLRFLSHLPIYSDFCLVEIELGGILSRETTLVHKNELQKRKQSRQNRVNADKRADALAQKKEEDRINELKTQVRRIDPEDEFFRVVQEPQIELTGEGFGPRLSASQLSHSTHQFTVRNSEADHISFSQVAREGAIFPSLGTSPNCAFPALGSSPPTRSSAKPSWGAPREKALDAPAQPTLAPTGKKKGRGKVLLFSTSTHRGSAS
jgi:hypothetical protein